MYFCCLLIFIKIYFFEKFFQEYHRVSNSLDPDQARQNVRPDLAWLMVHQHIGWMLNKA